MGDTTEHVSGVRLVALTLVMALVGFLILLDVSILSSAIPGTTTEFHSLPDSGYAALGPLAGKIYAKRSAKVTFIAFLVLLEIGSLVCAIARSSAVLIGGRVIAGAGGSGLFNGALTIITGAASLENRPVLIGVVMGFSELGVIVGPLLGGDFTQYMSWRWCFYINLCIDGPCTVILVFSRIPDISPSISTAKPSMSVAALRQLAQKLDLVGFGLFAPSAVLFLLALQLGGNRFPWSSATILGLFDGGFLGAFFFCLWEGQRGDRALMPTPIIRQRVVVVSMLHHAFITSTITLSTFYLPYYFQTVLNKSPVTSGVDLWPSILSQLIFTILSGVYIKRVGFYLPLAVLGNAMNSIGTGLSSTLSPSTATAKWIGYQIIAGAGRGCSFQLAIVAVQNSVEDMQVPEAMAMVMFAQNFGGSIATVVSTTIFDRSLKANVAMYAPSVPPEVAIAAGGIGSVVRGLLPPDSAELSGLLPSYSKAIDLTQCFSAGLAVAAFVVAWGSGWKDMRKTPKGTG
ncbi:major facilitator superfamily domain-containing protein [Diaporthe sp. PMI_573]|nr:major facilitator superfamily domain-containing protein [Diaporthaceae sp. PMI_573]